MTYYTGETGVQFQPHKRRQEMAHLLEALVDKHPTGTIYVVWDNANTHEDEEVDAVVQAAAGRLVLLYLPTYSPWLNPIEMLWRHFRREVTHCELFETMQALLAAARDFFDRLLQCHLGEKSDTLLQRGEADDHRRTKRRADRERMAGSERRSPGLG